MNEVIFLKTSAFGGYNKEDVDKLLQMLYSQNVRQGHRFLPSPPRHLSLNTFSFES